MVPPEQRTGVPARLQSMLNGGPALGAALGGLALAADTQRAYLAVCVLDAVSFLVCAAVLLRLPVVAPVAGRAAGEPRPAVLRDRPYALVTLLNAVLPLRMPLLSLAIPLWIVERTQAPGWLVSALFVLNTVAVMLFQVRTARPVADLDSARRALRVSGLVMAASCAVFALSALPEAGWVAAALLVAGAALQVDAEMRQSAGSWQIGFSPAPADRIGQYQGFFGTGVPVARTAGPLVPTSLLLVWGTRAGCCSVRCCRPPRTAWGPRCAGRSRCVRAAGPHGPTYGRPERMHLTRRETMLRGLATISFWADDLAAAKRWYTGLFGFAPYFERPGYIEFRIGDYQHELGIIDAAYAPPGAATGAAAGAVAYWHVDDVAAARQRLLDLGAKEYQPVTSWGDAGFVTASVTDPFGNVLGIMHNPHYLEIVEGATPDPA
ncbi:MFS transporter [Streptomyces sp. ISL-94]|uniref:MFS transporter n=1 Tax=Streptomyces sp. ISL-94 TaxID=2819190 RepID=UPI0027E52CFF|nr:MFS transporter [Streptomyces sp. ISL-94]